MEEGADWWQEQEKLEHEAEDLIDYGIEIFNETNNEENVNVFNS